MKRMSIVKKLILFISVTLIVTGIYGGGYIYINYTSFVKATNNASDEHTTKPDKVIINNNLSDKNQMNTDSKDKKNNDPNSYDAQKASDISNYKQIPDGEKIVFLTFDDGPSTTVTPQILNTLNKYNVKATFFLIGKMIESNQESKDIVKQIYEDGHAIGNHTYSHEYRTKVPGSLYYGNKVNVDQYMQEVDKTNQLISDAIGQTYNTDITRMPGGHNSREHYHDPNLEIFDEKLKERNMVNIDWNAYDGDSDGGFKSADQLFEEAKNQIGNQEKVVLLMHDTYGKEETAKALPMIIEYLKAQGYEFKKIS